MRKMQLRDFKANVSRALDEALRGKPTVVTRRGKEEGILLSMDEYRRIANVPSFARMLMASPFEDTDLPARGGRGLRRSGL